MSFTSKTACLAGLVAACLSPVSFAGQEHGDHRTRLKQAPMPHERQSLPPSIEQSKFNLAPTKKPRHDLLPPPKKGMVQALATTPECKDMNKLASYSGSALADYVANLPDYECHYGLFSLTPAQAATVYSPANLSALASRFSQEAASYNATNMKMVNLVIYLRAAYYVGYNGGTVPSATLTTSLRAPITQLAQGSALYASNAVADNTAGETLRLVTNMHDEPHYLPTMKATVQRFTNSAANPLAAEPLKQRSAAGGLTSALTVVFYAHSRTAGLSLLQNDVSYPTALNNFVVNNKSALLGSSAGYQLNDAANEAFRFLQYAGLKTQVRAMVQNTLNTSSMTGPDSSLWLAAASAVTYYDNANCSLYGTCNYETRLADAVLKVAYTCGPSLRIRAQEMSTLQLQESCNTLKSGETYFHTMLQTKGVPVANDLNSALELIIFDDYASYDKYAGAIYGIDTNNGGMYLEGDPAVAGNQARFIAHEAQWLRPVFKVWNLEHEYVHYLDGRFDMHGDFGAGVAKPTVWWIEGIAEYLSLRNNNQASIDAARTGTYKLSQIFGNTYQMSDYTARAYRWGYMATRFMNERHRADVDAMVGKFRVGDYDGYQNYMAYIGTRYDAEFATWVNAATTAGEPPLPTAPALPNCASSSQLGKNCSIKGMASSSQAWVYIMLPAGAKNLRLSTSGGTGDVDMYVALDRYPSVSSYDLASATVGNSESVSLATPASGRWYYIMLKAKVPFSGVSIGATYD